MKIDFSNINLQYLIQARDIAQKDPGLATTLLGLSKRLAELFAQQTSVSLANSAQIKIPLLTPRGEAWWWSRLIAALTDGCAEEVDAVLEHASVIVPTEE